MKLQIFSLAFDDAQFENIPIAENIMRVNLSKLELIEGIENSNQFCEHRIFLSDLPEKSDAEYFGFVSWRYNEKYPNLIDVNELQNLELRKNIVWVADKCNTVISDTLLHHPGIDGYLEELLIKIGEVISNNGFWSNQFIVHRDIYSQWQVWFREYFLYFHKKYGFTYDYNVIPEHENRRAGVFYERFSSLYFSNRTDLIIKQIPNK